MNECCSPCPEVQTINIPGVEGEAGEAGAAGSDGVNAYTQTTADFVVPIVGANETVSVLDSTWMAVGQKVVTDGPASFEVVSKPTSTSVVLQFMGYTDDVAPGATVSTGAVVSPSGTQGPDQTLLPKISSYAVGGSQALTATPAQILSLSVTLTEARSYLLIPSVRFDFSAATFADTENLTVKLRRTNNTAADITSAVAVGKIGVVSALSESVPFPGFPSVVYSAGAGDIVQMYASLSDTPYAGAINAVEGSILAIPLF